MLARTKLGAVLVGDNAVDLDQKRCKESSEQHPFLSTASVVSTHFFAISSSGEGEARIHDVVHQSQHQARSGPKSRT